MATRAVEPAPASGPGSPGQAVPIKDALRFGWQALTRRLGFLAACSFIVALVTNVLVWLRPPAPAVPSFSWSHDGVWMLIDFWVGTFFWIGFVNATLRICDNRPAKLGDLISAPSRVLRGFMASLLYFVPMVVLMVALSVLITFVSLVLAFGLSHDVDKLLSRVEDVLLLLLGGGVGLAVLILAVISATRSLVNRQFFGHLLVDEDLGVVESMQRSRTIARPVWRRLLLFDTVLTIGSLLVVAVTYLSVSWLDPMPLPAPFRHSVVPLPKIVRDVLVVGIGFLDSLAAWPLLIAHTFVYRLLVNPAGSPAPYDPPWAAHGPRE